jgi:succinyl-CoA synthetase alpha subunit
MLSSAHPDRATIRSPSILTSGRSAPVPVAGLVKPKTYRDSVALMVLSSALAEAEGVHQASAMMATPANLEILRVTGLFAGAFVDAGPNDLCIAVEARDDGALAAALARAEQLLASAEPGSGALDGRDGAAGGDAPRPRSLRRAVQARPAANVALISVPGEHAALEARQALLAGLHVFLFSDNVPLAEEVALKRLAAERSLLVMGPDCGTALIGGAPLGFANAVRPGSIGVVGSSGTGLQEVTSLIHRLGGGVSHALGTGSRDLYPEVGGSTFLAALEALAADPATVVLVGIAKPGDPTVTGRVLERLAATGKPAVVYFLGGADLIARSRGNDPHPARPRPGGEGRSAPSPPGRWVGGEGIVRAADLEHAARSAVALARGEAPPAAADPAEADPPGRAIVAGLAPGQRAVRGLFAGGTLAQEAAAAIARALGAEGGATAGERPGDVLRLGPHAVLRLGPHAVLDLGDDAYTRGRPHPLIDPRLRNGELVAQAGGGEVALFLIDVILGSGSHADPAGALGPALAAARAAADAAGARLEVLASLCGTDEDAQGYQRQRAALEASGVRVARSSSAAAAVAGRVAALLAEAG